MDDLGRSEVSRMLDRDGYVILERAAPDSLMDEIARELAPWLSLPVEQSPLPHNPFTGFRTLRTSALIAKSRACGELAMHPKVLALVERVLGPQPGCLFADQWRGVTCSMLALKRDARCACSSKNGMIVSTGSGKTIVEFFSVAISVSVCK
jgi:hypothetical protein